MWHVQVSHTQSQLGVSAPTLSEAKTFTMGETEVTVHSSSGINLTFLPHDHVTIPIPIFGTVEIYIYTVFKPFFFNCWKWAFIGRTISRQQMMQVCNKSVLGHCAAVCFFKTRFLNSFLMPLLLVGLRMTSASYIVKPLQVNRDGWYRAIWIESGLTLPSHVEQCSQSSRQTFCN